MIKKLFLITLLLVSVKLVAQTPILSNFRVENTHKNRVYFDSSEPITASSTKGFTISGKTISGIAVNSGVTKGHYLTVSIPFTFWDNNTIRLEKGDGTVNDFDLQYIVNNIAEPSASVDRYASISGSGSHDGTSEANAWTLQEAAANAIAGETVWVKAGGDFKRVSFNNNGREDRPIIIKGYVSTIGDLDGVSFHTYSIGDAIDNTSAPTLRGSFGTTNDRGFTISGDYIIVENFQSHGWKTSFYSLNNAGALIKNCVSHKTSTGRNPNPNGSGFYIRSDRTRIINSISINSDMNGFSSSGKNNLIKDCSAYTDSNSPGGDYFYQLRGSNNIIKGCLAKKTEKNSNGQHGFSVKSVGTPTEYNLIEDCTTWNSSFPIEARHNEVQYNVFRNIRVNSNPGINKKSSGGAIVIMNGASYNIFDKITVTRGLAGIRFLSSPEKKDAPTAGHDNVFKNCIFRENLYGITITEDTYGKNRETYNNYIQNCIFYSPTIMFNNKSDDVRGNHIINCSITDVVSKRSTTSNSIGWDYQNSNFYKNKSYASPSGNGNISDDPKYEDPGNGDFRLKSDSPLIDKGKILDNVNFDFDGNSRPQGASTDIGAFEKKNGVPNPNTVSADAGPDTTICSGSSTTLTASGGSDYMWSTGETTASITVSPTATTIYTVTVSEGSDSDSDEVEVIVETSPLVNLGDDITICSGDSINLTATGVGNFLWSTGETTDSITISPTTTTTYSVMADACSTTVSDEVVVTVNPGVTLDVGADITICTGESTTLTATTNGNVLWSTGETTSSITANPLSTTTYSVTSNLDDCSKTEEVVVTVSDVPTVDAGSDVSICEGEQITLTATGEGNFLWSTGETTSSIDVSPSITTTYTITASNSCSSDVSDEITVTVNPGVTLDVVADIAICTGESTTLTVTTNGSVLWSTGETTSSITVNPLSTTTYSVTSNLDDCSKTEEVVVTVSDPPTVDAGSDVSICEGEQITLTATGEGNFLWSTGQTTSSIDVSPSITTTYTVTASNSCSSDVSDEITVTVNPGVTLDVGADITICTGESTTLTATTNGNVLWSTGDTTSSITVNPLSTTTYSVVSSSGDCSKTAEIVVTVDNLPWVSLGANETICDGEELILTATGEGDFLWSTGETTRSIDVSPSTTTTYTVTASNSCSNDATDEITITVNPEVVLETGPDVIICNGESATLTASTNGNILWSTGETTASITVNPSSTTTYSVTSGFGDCTKTTELEVTVIQLPTVNAGLDVSKCSGDSVTLTATGIGNFLWSTGETTRSIDVIPSTITTYTVTATNSCGNDVTDEVIVNVNDPIIANAGEDIAIEQGQTTVLTATGGELYRWNTGETTSSITVQPNETTTYNVEVSNGNCSNTDSVIVNVEELSSLIINSGLDITICQGEEVALTVRGGINYLWNTGHMESTIIVKPEQTTTYTVTGLLNDDTLDTTDIVIEVDNCSNNRNKFSEFKVYPNPTTGLLNVFIPKLKSKIKLSLTSVKGKIVYNKDVKGDNNGISTQIDLSRMAKGIYFLRMYNGEFSETKKVLVI